MPLQRNTNVGGFRSANPAVAAYDDAQLEKRMAQDAAQQIVGRKRQSRDINALPPWWADYFDKIEEQQVAANLQGKGFRVNMSGFGNATSARQGGQTVGRQSIYGRPGAAADEPAGLSEAMRDVDEQLLRSQQLRANDQSLLQGAYAFSDAARDRLEASPDFQLGSGRYGRRAQMTGDVVRDQNRQDARAGASLYFDPIVQAQREAQVADEERLLTARYGREADAQAKIRAAEIAAGGRVGAAQATAGSAMDREWLRSLIKAREQGALLGGDPTETAAFESELRRNIPGLAPGAGGIDEPSFEALLSTGATGPGRQQLIEMWPNLSPDQQARVRQRLGTRR